VEGKAIDGGNRYTPQARDDDDDDEMYCISNIVKDSTVQTLCSLNIILNCFNKSPDKCTAHTRYDK